MSSRERASGAPLEQDLGFRLSRISRTLRRQWRDELADLDLAPPEAATLRAIVEHPGCALRALARLLATDPMSAKRCVDGLERRGLVASGHRAGDRRSRTLRASDAGLALFATLNERLRERERHLARLLAPNRRSALELALADLERGLDIEAANNEREPMNESPTNHQHHSTTDAAAMWNERFARDGWAKEPDEELVELASPLAPGDAIDLGCGTGRNALWLARHGWRVTGVDGSIVGLDELRRDALALELASPTTIIADLAAYEPPRESFDLVVLANIHVAPEQRPALFAGAAGAVRPGGHLYVIGHHLDALGLAGPPDPQRLYTEAVLEAGFSNLTIERLERLERRLEDGGDHPVVDVLLWATKPTVVAA